MKHLLDIKDAKKTLTKIEDNKRVYSICRKINKDINLKQVNINNNKNMLKISGGKISRY